MQNAESLIPLAPLILGQVPAVSATELGQWLFCAACVLVILNYAISFWKNITAALLKKQNSPGETYQTQSDCITKHKGIDEKLTKLSTDAASRSENLRLEIKEDVKGIHKRIDIILEGVATLKGQIK